MDNQENDVDLLDLDDNSSMDTLPDAAPLVAPRPKTPWLLLGVGVLIIALATYIIIRTVTRDESSSMEIDLETPIVVPEKENMPVEVGPMPVPVEQVQVQPNAPQPMPVPQPGAQMPMPAPVPAPMPVAQQPVAPQPVAQQPIQPQPMAQQPAPVENDVPVRVIEDRKPVTFDPSRAEQPAPKPVAQKPAQKKPVTQKPAQKQATTGGATYPWYVQFGSYSSRDAATAGQRKVRAAHPGLFQGRDFVIQEAKANGRTVYRLRVGFKSSGDANGFCRNAKSDGLDCYVTK